MAEYYNQKVQSTRQSDGYIIVRRTQTAVITESGVTSRIKLPFHTLFNRDAQGLEHDLVFDTILHKLWKCFLKFWATNPLSVSITISVIMIAGSSIDFSRAERIAAQREQKRHNESVEKLMAEMVPA